MNRLQAHIGPLWPYLVLIAIPTVAFVLPDLIGGHLLITGDNLQQNFPLHVLVGSMLRHGQLPFWNEYIFSGTPLMADFNAGAFYPLNGLFVVLPDRAAWIATEVILFSVIAVGMYVFLRALKLSTAACILAAATFAFAGPVLSQVNHVDMTEGFVAIPWMLLAVLHIVRDGRWRWTIVLGIAYAVGDPRWRAGGHARRGDAHRGLCGRVGRSEPRALVARPDPMRCGGSTGPVVGGDPVAPRARSHPELTASRGGVAAAAGSYPRPFTILGLVPYLNGGYGHLGEAQFFSQYNLPEIGIYLGILPVIALLTLLNPHWPSRIPPRDRLTWYAVGLFGLLLALGSNTPLEHLFNSLPLYGHQRLQSRNMITVATAVCVLFAGWIDRTEEPRRHDAMTRYDRVMALLPLGLVAALAIWALASPGSLVQTFAGVSLRPKITDTVREATAIALAFCIGAAVLVWIRPWLGRLSWVRLAAVFVVVDVGLMGVTSQLIQTPPNDLIAGTTPIEKLMAAKLPPGGRLVNYDPQTYSSYPGSPQGVPDLNIIPRLPSVSGYASIVNGNYESTTHTHEQDDLDIGQLASGMLGRLDLREVVTVPEYFLVPLQAVPRSLGDFTQISEGFGADPVLARGYGADFNETTYPFDPGPRPALSAGQTASWFYGETLRPEIRHGRARSPCQLGNARPLWGAAGGWVDTLGRRVARARGFSHSDRPTSGGRRHRSVRPGRRRLAPAAAGRRDRGWAPLRTGGLPVIGAGSGAVATRRVLPGLRGLHPSQAGRARHRLDPGRSPSPRTDHVDDDEVRTGPGAGACSVDGDPLRRVGLGMDRNGLSEWWQRQEHPGARLRPRPASAHTSGQRRRDVPLSAPPPPAGERPQPRRARPPPGLARCLVGPTPPAVGAGAGCRHRSRDGRGGARAIP